MTGRHVLDTFISGPLSVLKATFDMELQPRMVDLGSAEPGEAEQEVTCYPDLCGSNKGENVAQVEHPGSLGRLNGSLSLLQEEPTIEVTSLCTVRRFVEVVPKIPRDRLEHTMRKLHYNY